MILIETTIRISAAVQLSDISLKLRELRSFICFDFKDIDKIDSAITDIDCMVNKIMGVKCN